MKFKLTVLTLLVVGLVFGLSGSAFATVTFSLDTTNSIADADVEIATTGIPATVISVANDSTAAVSIDNLSVQTVDAADGDGFYEIWWDKDENGIVTVGDVKVLASTALVPNATTNTSAAMITPVVVPADSTTSIIFVVNTTGATNAGTIKIGTGGAAQIASNTSDPVGAFFVNDATAGSEPDPTLGSMATITAITDAGADAALSALAGADAVAAGTDIPNLSSEIELLNFTVTADAGVGMTITAIGLADGGTTVVAGAPAAADVVESVDVIKVYIDNAPLGDLTDADIELLLTNNTYDADPEQIVLTSGVYIPGAGTVNLLVTGSLTGANEDGDVISMATAAAQFLVASGDVAAAGDVTGAIQTLEALTVAAETKDITGVSGLPNGYLDAVLLKFKVGGVAKNITDSTFDVADWDVVTGTEDFAELAKVTTYNGDTANNSEIYIKFTEIIGAGKPLAAVLNSTSTNGTPAMDYVAGTQITSTDGLYALPAQAAANLIATDTAPPVPLSVTMIDADGNGMLDGVNIQFSEVPTGAALGTGAGLTIPGYDFASGAAAAGGGVWNYGNTLWAVVIDEEDFDTGEKPGIAYSSSAGLLKDAANVAIKSWTPTGVPVMDGAAPKLVQAETKDLDDNGAFDAVEFTFSEAVTSTDWSGIEFVAPQLTVYTFDWLATMGDSTAVITIPVGELGGYDTAVMPNMEYVAGGAINDLATTPNALADINDFVNVYDIDDVLAQDDVYLVDGISPRILSAETADNDVDGKLDGMNLTFSEPMGLTASTYDSLSIGTYVIADAVINGTDVAVVLTEKGYDTGDLPAVTYTKTGIVDLNNGALAALAPGDVTVKDAAAPVLYLAETEDMAYGDQIADNGQIDGMTLYFSEAIDSTDISDIDAVTLGFSISNAGYSVMAEDLMWASGLKSAVIAVTESGNSDSGFLPDINYDQSTAIYDQAAVPIALLAVGDADVDEEDAARPSITAMKNIDYDGDGWLDGIQLVFSELMDRAGMDSTVIASRLDVYNTGISFNDGVTIIAAASDSIWNFVGFAGSTSGNGNTGQLSHRLTIRTTSSIEDMAGNEVNDHNNYSLAGYYADGDPVDDDETYDPTLDSDTDADSYTLDTDGAAPVIMKAMAQVTSNIISVQFSEDVTGATASLDDSDLMYTNVFDTDDPISLDGISVPDAADSSFFLLETDLDISLEQAMIDSITVKAAKVQDLAAVPNVAVSKNVIIIDAINPTVVSVSTMDVNGNGMIDNIKVVFSEDIKDENLVGYTSGVITDPDDSQYGLNTIGAKITYNSTTKQGVEWTVGDYRALCVNFTQSTANATRATVAFNYAVYNVNDVPNDEILYIALKESGTSDTDATPLVSFISGSAESGGAGVSDFSPNYVTMTATAADDAAGPAIVSAKMTSETEMEVTLSEELEDPLPLASATFKWLVGNQSKDYAAEGWILNMIESTPGVLSFETQNGTNVPSMTESTIEFIAAGVLADAADGATNVAGEAVDVAVFDGGVNVEADLPDAFALSNNFPNPFNPTTTIEYAIPADGAGHVELVVYNENGQKVRTLVSEIQEAGYYNVVWDGRNDSGEMVSSGLYMYRIVSGSFNQIEKMTFIK